MKQRRDCQKSGLSGELFVAAELLKRDFQVSLTLGNAKAIDLFAYWEATDKAYEVQVKTLRTSNCYLLRIQNVTPTRNEAPATDYAVRFCPLITVNYGNHLLVMLFTRPPSSSPTDTAV